MVKVSYRCETNNFLQILYRLLTRFSLFHVFLFNLVSLFPSKCHDKTLKNKLFISIKYDLIIGRDMSKTGCEKN